VMANEHRAMTVSLPYMLHGLGPAMESRVAVRAAWTYGAWRQLLSQRAFTGQDLLTLESLSSQTQQAIDLLAQLVTGDHVINGIKFHMILHWSEIISLFGAPANYDTETWDSAHKVFVKPWISKLGHSPGQVLMQKDQLSSLHSTHPLLPEDRENGKTRGVYGYFTIRDLLFEWQGQLKRVAAIDDTTPITIMNAVWSRESNCWVREGHAIMINCSPSLLGLVRGLVVIDKVLYIVLDHLQRKTPSVQSTNTHILYEQVQQNCLQWLTQSPTP